MKTFKPLLITLCVCADALAAGGQSAESGGSIFSGSFAESLWTVVAFLLLLIVLGKFAWKPMLKALKDREEHIRSQIESAEHSRKEAQEIREDIEQRRSHILQEATDRAFKHEQELTEAAHRKVSEMRHQASQDIEKARAAAEDRLWEQAGDIMLVLGTKVLGRAISDEDNKRLVSDAITELNK
ncbi:MAG: F0F1 ATP synthase subunit B [Sedimentisphaerales bacterium]|jgi:F-type H+-transporting ATPase subunit b